MENDVKTFVKIINQFFELEKKVKGKPEAQYLQRNLDRITELWAESGLEVYDPTGEPYNETRTDCEANIAGDSISNLKITEVIKPVVYLSESSTRKTLVQRAIVVVESVK
jgi:hypothetical protein